MWSSDCYNTPSVITMIIHESLFPVHKPLTTSTCLQIKYLRKAAERTANIPRQNLMSTSASISSDMSEQPFDADNETFSKEVIVVDLSIYLSIYIPPSLPPSLSLPLSLPPSLSLSLFLNLHLMISEM